MTRAQALAELIAKVEAGEFPSWPSVTRALGLRPDDRHIKAYAAHNGSLDAALALHQAVLPEWDWRVYKNKHAGVEKDGVGNWMSSCDSNPARAWLLAILKALHAQEQEMTQ